MKKALSIAAIVIGVFALLCVAAPMIIGIIYQIPTPESVGIIGGADGPTAFMVSGMISTGNGVIETVVGILLIVTGILGLKKAIK